MFNLGVRRGSEVLSYNFGHGEVLFTGQTVLKWNESFGGPQPALNGWNDDCTILFGPLSSDNVVAVPRFVFGQRR